MKYLQFFLLGISIFLIGCSLGPEMPKTVVIYGYDFTKYTASGFLFTPEPYNGEYDAIGLIDLIIYPEIKKTKTDSYTMDEEYKMVNKRSAGLQAGEVTAREVLDSLYTCTKKMGADAVVRLKIENTPGFNNGINSTMGIKASGFAIKRKR